MKGTLEPRPGNIVPILVALLPRKRCLCYTLLRRDDLMAGLRKIRFTRKAIRGIAKLQRAGRKKELVVLRKLVGDIAASGPTQGGYPGYSKLGGDKHHCHLSYRWVACWQLEQGQIKIVEVYYVGSREDAPY